MVLKKVCCSENFGLSLVQKVIFKNPLKDRQEREGKLNNVRIVTEHQYAEDEGIQAFKVSKHFKFDDLIFLV